MGPGQGAGVMSESASRGGATLPAELTSFVGRRPEIGRVKELLGTSRLVTLTGVGGVGKTRLALRVARDVRRVFADGVYLIELAALKDPALLPHSVVDALGIAEQSTRPPMTVLVDHLRHRHVLLVLDNCEHLLEASAELTDALLRAAPQVRVLATSRQALMVAGEQLAPVSTLPVPDPDVPLAAGLATQYPGLALFAERAAAVVPDFKVTHENQDAVIRLCHRLEGIPLAIELAAVRLRVLPVTELADRLDDRFRLLTQGSRTAPERHQTLQATIDYSYQLCSSRERLLWARASVFAGGFTLDAAEAACVDDELPHEAILDTVAALAEKSILTQEENAGGGRFRMLETLREYGQARLDESGGADAARRRHRDWCLHLVECACAEWFSPAQERWALRLRGEHANLRTALEYCVTEPGQARIALRMAGLPWFLWMALGFMTEGRLWLDRALQLETEPSRDRAWALGTAAHVAVLQGDEDAEIYLEQCLALGHDLHDDEVIAYATHLHGLMSFLKAELKAGAKLFEEALQQYRKLPGLPEDYLTGMLIQAGVAYLLLDDLDRATELLQEMHERCTRAQDSWLLSYAVWGVGFAKLVRGELDEAETDLREALRIKRFFHDTLGLAFALDVLAWTQIAKGEAESGATILGGASEVWQTVGAQLFGSADLIDRRERFEKIARDALGDSAFDVAFARGADQSLQDLLATVLDERPVKPDAARDRRGPSTLTPRESEVADLIADGLANKEIAAALVISLRTAEAHVEHILSKLGFTSRTQVAAWVTEQRAAS